MRSCRHTFLLLAALALAIATAPAANLAFSYVSEGDPLPPMMLEDLKGTEVSYLGEESALARVFIFLKGGHPRSRDVAREAAELVPEFQGRRVHWAAIVSDRHGTAWADSFAAVLPGMDVLIDRGDALYGKLGVVLSPVVGIGNAEGILHAYLPYRKVHFQAALRTQLRLLLGDIDASEADALLNPDTTRIRDTEQAACLRKLKLAGMLATRGKTEKARVQVEAVLERCPELPEAYEALADILREQGDLQGAENASRRAADLR